MASGFRVDLTAVEVALVVGVLANGSWATVRGVSDIWTGLVYAFGSLVLCVSPEVLGFDA